MNYKIRGFYIGEGEYCGFWALDPADKQWAFTGKRNFIAEKTSPFCFYCMEFVPVRYYS